MKTRRVVALLLAVALVVVFSLQCFVRRDFAGTKSSGPPKSGIETRGAETKTHGRRLVKSLSFPQRLAVEIEAVQSEADSSQRQEKLEKLVETISADELATAMRFLNERNQTALGRELEQRLIRRWAEKDVTAAATLVMQMPAGPSRLEAVGQVAIVWANQDIAAAARWVRQLPAEEKQSGLLDVAYEAARTEPLAGLNLAAEISAGKERDNLLCHALSQWAATDPRHAAQWLAPCVRRGIAR